MSSNSENPQPPLTLESLAQSTAFTLKVHADMIMSIDTKLERVSISIENLAENTRRNTEAIQALIERATKLDTKFDRLAQLMTGLFQKHDERITRLETRQ